SLPAQAEAISNLIAAGRLVVLSESVAAPGLYHMGDVYVYPTRLEGIGLTIAEAMSVGLPVIVPNNQPMTEFICEKTCKVTEIDRFYKRDDGYYWDQCEVNVDSLVDAMRWYINNTDLISRLKRETRDYAVSNINWSKNSSCINSLVEGVDVSSSNLLGIIEKARRFDDRQMKGAIVYRANRRIYR